MLDYSEVRFAALEGLLGSAAGVEAFFEQYWERCPLLVKDARWPKDLLTSEGIEDLISFRRHGTDIVLARTAFDGAAERATYSSRHSTDAADIDQAWRDGSTIIITGIHRREHVALFIQELEGAFQHAVGANLYFHSSDKPRLQDARRRSRRVRTSVGWRESLDRIRYGRGAATHARKRRRCVPDAARAEAGPGAVHPQGISSLCCGARLGFNSSSRWVSFHFN